MAQRPTKLDVEILSKSVSRDLGRQTSQQLLKSLGPMTFEGKDVFELVYDPLDDLSLSRCPATVGLRPRPFGVVFWSRRYQCSVKLQPALLPLHTCKALVCEEGFVSIFGDEELSYRSLVGGGLGQTKSHDDAFGADREGYLETVDPFCFGSTAAEGGLPGEQTFATGTHPDDSWVYEKLYRIYRSLYQAMRKVSHALSDLQKREANVAIQIESRRVQNAPPSSFHLLRNYRKSFLAGFCERGVQAAGLVPGEVQGDVQKSCVF